MRSDGFPKKGGHIIRGFQRIVFAGHCDDWQKLDEFHSCGLREYLRLADISPCDTRSSNESVPFEDPWVASISSNSCKRLAYKEISHTNKRIETHDENWAANVVGGKSSHLIAVHVVFN